MPDLFEVSAAYGSLEERVACEDGFSVDDEGDHVVGMPGRRDGFDVQPADLDTVCAHRQAELGLVLHMVVMRVRPQYELRLDAPALGG